VDAPRVLAAIPGTPPPIERPKSAELGALSNALKESWKRYKKRLKKSRQKLSDKRVHDLRVSARRLRAALVIMGAVLPRFKAKPINRRLKKNAAMLDKARDLAVQTEAVRNLIPSHPALSTLEKKLISEKQTALKKGSRKLKRLETKKLKKPLLKAIAKLGDEGEKTNWLRKSIEAAKKAYTNVLERKKALDESDPMTIHRMRIAFKKFRYMVELLKSTGYSISDARMEEMRQFQQSMGRIQDMKVLLERLAEAIRDVDLEKKMELLRIEKELLSELKMLAHDFIDSADKVESFALTPPQPKLAISRAAGF